MNKPIKTNEFCIICDNKPTGKDYVKTDKVNFLKCPKCSLIWRIYPQEDLTNYDKPDYFQTHYKSQRKKRIKKSLYQLSIIEHYVKPGGLLLEVGCSMGYFLQAAKSKGWEAIGIDVGDYPVNECKSQGFEAYKLSACDVASLNKKFKVIVLKHVFEHLHDPIGQLNTFYNILEDDGLIFINLPNARYFKACLLKEKYKFYSPEFVGYQHYYYYNPNNLARLLKKCNFEVLMKADLPHSILGKFLLAKEFSCIAKKISSK